MHKNSDILEYLDESILAPRVYVEDKKERIFRIKHPLPDNLKAFPSDNPLFTKETMKRLFELGELDTNVEIRLEKNRQEIINPNGRIIIENGFCESKKRRFLVKSYGS